MTAYQVTTPAHLLPTHNTEEKDARSKNSSMSANVMLTLKFYPVKGLSQLPYFYMNVKSDATLRDIKLRVAERAREFNPLGSYLLTIVDSWIHNYS